MGAGTTSLPLHCRRRAAATATPTRDEGALLAQRVSRRIAIAQLAAGLGGALDVFALLWLVLPTPAYDVSELTLVIVNAATLAVVLPAGGAIGWVWGGIWFRPVRAWLVEGRPPTAAERRATLRVPLRCAIIGGTGWVAAAAVFFALNVPFSFAVACHVASTILLGGVTCVALGYLLTERLVRPLTARVLAFGPVAPLRPGVKGRLVLTWAAATGVPLVGLLLLGIHVLTENDQTTVPQLAWSIVALAGVTVMAGLLGTVLVAKSLAEPLTGLRRALTRVEEGDLSARVAVDDGSELGLVQSRFNAMTAGLEERERLRDLFGRHVGEDVVREALDGDGTRLGGEVRDVAVLFVDLVGSTALAAARPPREVVGLLNDFFAIVVEVVGRHGGWVNKFEGDAALVVFGAPAGHPDCAGAALAAARDLHAALDGLPLSAGIGVSAGPAVAGNVGAEERFEYTVIGDPVNEAARLCDLAKRRDDSVLASWTAVERAVNGEGDRWSRCDEIVLRGRREATRVAAPRARASGANAPVALGEPVE